MLVAVTASRSAIGPEYMIPSMPIIKGRPIINGSRKMILLVRLRKVPFSGLPIDVKKLADIGWILFRKTKNIYILKYLSAKAKYISEPSPKMPIICLGKSWNIKNATMQIAVPEEMASFTTLRTRS